MPVLGTHTQQVPPSLLGMFTDWVYLQTWAVKYVKIPRKDCPIYAYPDTQMDVRGQL